MTTTNPLSYLSDQLEAWHKAGTYQRLRVLESPCEPVSRFDGRCVRDQLVDLANEKTRHRTISRVLGPSAVRFAT